jgi:hypothetical protein
MMARIWTGATHAADPDAYQQGPGRRDSRYGERRQHRGGGRADGDAWAGRVPVLGQKLLAARTVVDVPLALVIVALGVLIIVDPSPVPGLTPAM